MSGEREVAEWRVFPVAPEKMHSKGDGGVEGETNVHCDSPRKPLPQRKRPVVDQSVDVPIYFLDSVAGIPSLQGRLNLRKPL